MDMASISDDDHSPPRPTQMLETPPTSPKSPTDNLMRMSPHLHDDPMASVNVVNQESNDSSSQHNCK